MPMAELARRAGMSALAVAERVQRLERAGVIAGHHLDIDPAAVAPTPTVPADQDLPEQPNAPPRIVPAARRSCERFLVWYGCGRRSATPGSVRSQSRMVGIMANA